MTNPPQGISNCVPNIVVFGHSFFFLRNIQLWLQYFFRRFFSFDFDEFDKYSRIALEIWCTEKKVIEMQKAEK